MKNHIAILLDQSSSMAYHGLTNAAMAAFNKIAASIKKSAIETAQETTVTYITFADTADVKYAGRDARFVSELTDYRSYGNTALFDAVGRATEELDRLHHDSDTSYLVMAITDGEENHSRRHSSLSIADAIRDRQGRGNWSFVFQVPPGAYSQKLARDFKIPLDNICEWGLTEAGLNHAAKVASDGVENYYRARSTGKKAVTTFFVTTDLSKVKPKDVTRKLTDLSDQFRLLDVPKEQAIRDFVEQKTGKAYVVGCAYYLLMKPEKVQAKKKILIMEKGKKAVWGGDEARDMIGLPVGAEAKVTPGNHNAFDIYCQSTSVNRILPRGTKVLVDMVLAKDEQETWDSKAVAKAKAKPKTKKRTGAKR